MTIVLDANILLRYADTTAADHPTALAAVAVLRSAGHVLRAVPQAGYEFWVVATRPVANNGLGWPPATADAELASLERLFPVLDDPPGLYAGWRQSVVTHGCRGKPAHDARYVAAMQLHGLTHLLTFNTPDFARFPNVTALDPAAVAAGQPVP